MVKLKDTSAAEVLSSYSIAASASVVIESYHCQLERERRHARAQGWMDTGEQQGTENDTGEATPREENSALHVEHDGAEPDIFSLRSQARQHMRDCLVLGTQDVGLLVLQFWTLIMLFNLDTSSSG